MRIKSTKIFLIKLWNSNTQVFKILLFFVSAILLISFFPREGSLKFDYEKGKPWLHEDLIAPFNFPIQKSKEEINVEKQLVLDEVKLYFRVDTSIYHKEKNEFLAEFEDKWEISKGNDFEKQKNLNVGLKIIDSLYHRGIIQQSQVLENSVNDSIIYLFKNNVAEERKVSDFFTVYTADDFIKAELKKIYGIRQDILLSLLLDVINHNVKYDEKTSEKLKQAALDNISLTSGMVQLGENIISQGELVTNEKELVLESFKEEYQKHVHSQSFYNLVLFGQFLLVCISITLLALFLAFYRKDIFSDNKKIVLILFLIILMIYTTSTVIRVNAKNLYLVPICIVPIIIRVFYDTRLAQFVHIIMIILIGFLTPNSFEFVFLQLVTGVIAIISIIKLQQRGQFFLTALYIFMTYFATYTGLMLMKGGSFKDVDFTNYTRFAGSAMLTLFSYPLIFLFEKIFGLVTDVSLMELSDTNSKLLRELSRVAPGTFQHSLRVANIAEEIILQIDGKALLVRTGAMYHDIGKMDSPMYFTENQLSGINPHDDISYEESAKIIINHVIRGVERAKKHNLPEEVINFIRTHHGTTRVQYFYLMHLKDYVTDIDEKIFTYHGPIPFSKETAVLMFVDAVEAAARSLKNPDEKAISNLVDSIIDNRIENNQLINSNITLKEITIIRKTLKKQLMNIYHVRIEYPS